MEESERERAGERERVRANGSVCERWCRKYRLLGASEQPVEEQLRGGGRRPLRSRQKRRRAKCKSLLWKGKEGCLRIKMGPDSLGLFVEGGMLYPSGVEDLEKKRFNIFIPKGRGGKGGWVAMVETLRALGVATERKESQKDKAMPLVPSLGKSFAEVVKLQNHNGRSVARVEVSHKDLNRNLKRLDHCLVGSWDPKSMRGMT
ncbi:hypothetical protein CK203_048014 [Vitis vinifera]|uniref:Uncharacterized protein n=1 Tax=Vitis vinifera TaxID=29760 RepID=A0A438GH46_VITVI|nr:hypothetical protein CK203_048014 [Vitis vinifera]